MTGLTKQIGRILLIAGLLVSLLAGMAVAAASTDLKATKTASQQTVLVWTLQGGDEIEYSLDGLAWSAVGPAAAGSGVRIAAADAVDGNSQIIGLTDYTNYYFRIKNAATYSNVVDAFPPNEHAHRYFASDTGRCASCHATHTAQGAKLLKETSIDDTCKTCHAGGTGSKYQVDRGTVSGPAGTTLTAPGGLFGTKLAAGAGMPVPTGWHPLGRAIGAAPGADPAMVDPGWNEILTCGSCHNAHDTGDYQYRLLRKQLPNMKLNGNGILPSIKVEAYAKTGAGREDVAYVSGLDNFCGGCHADYNTTAVNGPGHTRSGIFNPFYYRHAVGADIAGYAGVGLSSALPLASAGTPFVWDGSTRNSGKVLCLTCHKVHGTQTTPNLKLLRLDNRGVCQECHKK